jgi:hypothetical protein
MKKQFLVFGSNALIKQQPTGGGNTHTSGDAGFSTPPMGAKPPTA